MGINVSCKKTLEMVPDNVMVNVKEAARSKEHDESGEENDIYFIFLEEFGFSISVKVIDSLYIMFPKNFLINGVIKRG